MKIVATALPGVMILEPTVRADDRGSFVELWHAERYARAGIAQPFVQDNLSRSAEGVVRGLHFQEPRAQGKLVQVLRGAIFDVAVDVRRGSPTFGRFVAVELSDRECRQMWIPGGFAHGFCALTDGAELLYKCTELYAPEAERCILWNDPELGIPWPVTAARLSPKDAAAPRLRDAPVLPVF